MQTAQFSEVSNGKCIKLSSIVPVTSVNGLDLNYNVEIQRLTSGGETIEDQDYAWINDQWCDWDGNPVEADKIEIPCGSALWVFNYTEQKVNLQSAGEVSQLDVDVALDLEAGAVAAGNPFPIALTLSQIVPVTSVQGLDLNYNVEIQYLTSGGETIEDQDYAWINDQWCDWDGNPVEADKITVTPGDGMWVFNYTEEAVSLRFPAPEL